MKKKLLPATLPQPTPNTTSQARLQWKFENNLALVLVIETTRLSYV